MEVTDLLGLIFFLVVVETVTGVLVYYDVRLGFDSQNKIFLATGKKI